MAKTIAWIDQARSDIRAKDRETALGLLHGLARFLARFLAPDKGDVKRLRALNPPELPLRLGNYRIRFYHHGEQLQILRVRNRKDAYRQS